ncbi:hypothetical protein X797_000680 [Metarhizium robertsii]|uniref:Uncharacterized protein n=2 Tax=Metarhizium robertsii TaxID=568076 RepID=E9EPQ5_METRA|nr:uncharacterized protein MAA_02318 [Metarhizium robertsii ARSEF 23]EFZ02736.1 hypothetical protein MAA_02318 [Metarhizium robertsii ARSEF 23]EXV05963.1 hypothetical protein X797_000680 [Metarhizium robertsii]
MQYPLLLVAAFATASIAASIAAPAAGPPASTQGKEDVAKEVGKLAEEACPRDQLVYNGGKGLLLRKIECKCYANKCLQGGIIEPAKLKECINDARIKSKKPARYPQEPAKEA